MGWNFINRKKGKNTNLKKKLKNQKNIYLLIIAAIGGGAVK